MALEYCDLFNMGYKGPKYTWSNCQRSKLSLKRGFDRGVANQGWYELYPVAEVLVEASTTSDHALLMVSMMGSHKGEPTRRRFQYEAKWSLEQGYNEVVSCEWEQPMGEGD
jgi:hypothetical protein